MDSQQSTVMESLKFVILFDYLNFCLNIVPFAL